MSEPSQQNPGQQLRPTPFVAEGTFFDAGVRLTVGNGKYKLEVEGNVEDLSTSLFQRYANRDNLLKGGSVVVLCFALYKLGFKAYDFAPGSVAFNADLPDDEQAKMRANIESGSLRTALQEQCTDIIRTSSNLSHLNGFELRAISIVGDKAEVKNVITGGTFEHTPLHANAGNVYEHGATVPAGTRSGSGEKRVTNEISGATFKGGSLNLNAGDVHEGPKKK